MWPASFRFLALILPGWGPTSYLRKGGGRTGRIQPDGFTAQTNTDGQSHSLLVQRSVLWFFLGHHGLMGRCQAGGRSG